MPKNLKSEMIKLHHKLRAEIKTKYNRTLPFAEELNDRWERAKYLGFGEGASIYDSSIVMGDVKAGKNTWIGPYTLLEGMDSITIGSYCSISTGVQIVTHDSVKWALTGGRMGYEMAPVKIGDCCYIGSSAIILKGVTIGDHSVIGASSLVNRDIPPYSIAVGVPAKVVGRVIIRKDAVVFEYFKKMGKKRKKVK